MNVFAYVKKNPKKSIFGTIVSGCVGKYSKGLYDDHEYRHAVCRDIKDQGTATVNWQHNPKSITVLLNPAAYNGKATKLFEKNAAPIFHLSGCNVKVIRLEYEGQAKQLMSVLENTDVIVAAGGNGTVNEVIAGLMRRPDFDKWANIPIGVLPLGETNTLFFQLCCCQPSERRSQQIVNAACDILKNQSKSVDVMKITGENGKSVYALSDLRWGSYSDAFDRMSKYWFWGPLKKYMTFVFASYKSNTKEPRQFELKYTVFEPKLQSTVEEEAKAASSIADQTSLLKIRQLLSSLWHFVVGSNSPKSQPPNQSAKDDMESPPDYDTSGTFKTLEMSASVNAQEDQHSTLKGSAQISIEQADFSTVDFIKNGLKRFSTARPQPIQLESEIHSSRFRLTPNVEGESWFKIDNENFEAMPCNVCVLPKKVKLIFSNLQSFNA